MSWFFEKADKVAPTDHWDFYFCRVDDLPASIFVDLGRAKAAPLKGKDYFAYLRLYMLKPRPDGLSSDDEFEKLKEIEDRVEPSLRKDCRAIYVGRNTSNGCRDFYFYVSDLDKFIQSTRRVMLNYPDYTFESDGRHDSEWSTYFDFLYPSPYHKQCILNRQVCEALKEAGDDLSLERLLDHRVYFEKAEDKSAFEIRVQEMGFILQNGCDDELPLACDFSKLARPIDADDVLADLLQVVKEFNGDYDGWGCEAVGASSVKVH